MKRRLPLPFFLLGLLALYISERTLANQARWIGDMLAGLTVLAGFVLALSRIFTAQSERRRAYRWILLAYGISLLGVGCYSIQGIVLTWPWTFGSKLASALQVVWPALVLLGLLPAVAMELSMRSMMRTPTLEIWRVRLAARAASTLGLAVVTFAGLNFTASTWNRKVDLSYFKTTQVGASTRSLVKNLTQPVQVILFFPPGNDVLEQARGYAETLAQESPLMKVEVVDQALDPERARALRVRSNGYMALQAGSNSELLHLDLDLEEARSTLRNLDVQVQQRLLKVLRPERIVYVTTGHSERDYAPSEDDKRLGLMDFKLLLESQGFRVRRLGLMEGLGSAIPKDASVVAVMGPLEDFLPAERDAFLAYLQAGGRAWVAVDPDLGSTQDRLLAPLGLKVGRALVANERYVVRVEGRGESPYHVVTNHVGSHPSVQTLGQHSGRMGVVLLGAGALRKVDPMPADTYVTFTLHAMPQSWEDTQSNRKFDPRKEKREALELAAAVERPVKISEPAQAPQDGSVKNSKPRSSHSDAMRVVVVGDADVAGNGVVLNPGNAYFILDAFRWLAGEEHAIGAVESEKDIPLVHRKDKDALWFYGTSFGVPALVLVGGMMLTRRAGRKPRHGDVSGRSSHG